MSGGAIVFENVSKFYGEILGVNRVDLKIAAGITSLVGPNGSGKTTLMNLLTGLIRPTRGTISVLGISSQRQLLFQQVGYCSQFDSFPSGVNGFRFIQQFLWLHGYSDDQARQLTQAALEQVGLADVGHRPVAAYSKGMRQRVRLAQAMAHRPNVLVLDEPLNGLDPMARAEVIALFRELAREGKHLIISSHILHEVDMISDEVILLNQGYVVAEGDVVGIRGELSERPASVTIRCDRAHVLAAKLFAEQSVAEVKLHKDGGGLLARTVDADAFHRILNRIVIEEKLAVRAVLPADEDVAAVYEYLIGDAGGPS